MVAIVSANIRQSVKVLTDGNAILVDYLAMRIVKHSQRAVMSVAAVGVRMRLDTPMQNPAPLAIPFGRDQLVVAIANLFRRSVSDGNACGFGHCYSHLGEEARLGR